MNDSIDAVRTLHEAARGWRSLREHVEETLGALDQEVRSVLATGWRGSGAEGFGAQWATLRSAVQEALPALELAAADLESAAEAAQSMLSSGAGEPSSADGGYGGDSGDYSSAEIGSAGSVSEEARTARSDISLDELNALVSEKLDQGLFFGGALPGSETTGQAMDDIEAGGDDSGSRLAGSSTGSVSAASHLASAAGDSNPGSAAEGSSPGAAPVVPMTLRTESVVAELSRLAAVLATVFERNLGRAPGGGLGDVPLPSLPPDSSIPRPTDLFDQSLGADTKGGAGEESGEEKPEQGTDSRPEEDAGAPEKDTGGSVVDPGEGAADDEARPEDAAPGAPIERGAFG